MKFLSQLTKATAIILLALTPLISIASDSSPLNYFSLGPKLDLEYRGTYEFAHMHVEFTRSDSTHYIIQSSGDQSPTQDKLISRGHYIYWVLGNSGENWLKLKDTFHIGDHWHNRIRGWNQTYRVVTSDLTLSVPAGEFKHCVKISISWTAHEHDMEGPQRIDLYLAPGLGIVKRSVYSGKSIEHEEVLTSYTKSAGV